MNMKKFISAASALTIAASAFAGMAVTANAAYSYDAENKVYTWAPDSSEFTEKGGVGTHEYNGLTIVTASNNDWAFYNSGAMYGLASWKGASSDGNRYISYTPSAPGVMSVDVGSGSIYIANDARATSNMDGVSNNTVNCVAGETYYVLGAEANTWVKSMTYQEKETSEITAQTYTLPTNIANNNQLITDAVKDPVNNYGLTMTGDSGSVTEANVDFYLAGADSAIRFGIMGRSSGKPTVNTYFNITPGKIEYVTSQGTNPSYNTTIAAGNWYRMTITATNGQSPMSIKIVNIASQEVVYEDANVYSRNASKMSSKFFCVESSTNTYLANVNVYNPTTTYTYKVDGTQFATSTVVTGTAPSAPETAPVKENYKFVEWKADDSDPTVYNAVFEAIEKPAEVKAEGKNINAGASDAASLWQATVSTNGYSMKKATADVVLKNAVNGVKEKSESVDTTVFSGTATIFVVVNQNVDNIESVTITVE